MDFKTAAEDIVKAFYGYCNADSKWPDQCFEDAKYCAVYHMEQMQKHAKLDPYQERVFEELKLLEFNEKEDYYDL